MAEGAMGPGVGASEEGCSARCGEIPPGVMGVIHGSPFRKTRQVRHGLSGVTIERDVLGGERVKDKNEDIGRIRISSCALGWVLQLRQSGSQERQKGDYF